MKRQNIILFFILALLLYSTAFADNSTYSYYKSDGELLDIEVFDSLITIRFDTTNIMSPDELAAQYTFLNNDYDFTQLNSDFFVFEITSDHNLSEALTLLRSDSNILMVNPVIKSQNGKAIYLTNQIVARYNPEISLNEIDSINNIFGLSNYDSTDEASPYYFLEFNSATCQ